MSRFDRAVQGHAACRYYPLMAALSSFRSVGDAAIAAQQMLSIGEPLRRVWRFALVQLLDDYTSVLRHDGIDSAAKMYEAAPPRTGNTQIDAGFAALAEHLARRDGWAPPAWTRDPALEATPWWFVTDLRGMHARALVESPLSFRRRGVFITRDALQRV
jgi:class 3 adenylate cyclase